ncbi:MAG: matrixin family metalloprotease [Chloroflexales bacterium]|nr:matrixin family metalloprotease [Chloroflexales bacterium]
MLKRLNRFWRRPDSYDQNARLLFTRWCWPTQFRVVLCTMALALALSACAGAEVQPSVPTDVQGTPVPVAQASATPGASLAQDYASQPESPNASAAGMVLDQSVADLAGEAEYIVIGAVRNVQSDWNADQSAMFTTVDIDVQEYLKGSDAAPTLTLTLPGGVVGTISQIDPNTPVFTSDTSVLLFLKQGSAAGMSIVGGWQGRYLIEGEEAFQPETQRRVPLAPLKDEIKAAAVVPLPSYAGAFLIEQSIEELSAEADRILIGKVLTIREAFTPDRQSINTTVRLEVQDVLKGEAASEEVLVLPGGSVGWITLMVGGVPNFLVNEQTLLFLADDSPYVIAGMWQGKYSLTGNEGFQPETGQTIHIAELSERISNALESPVTINPTLKIAYARYTLSCAAWQPDQIPVPHYVNPANPGTGAPAGTDFVRLAYDALYAWQALPDSWIAQQVAGTTTRNGQAHFDGNNDIVWSDLSGATLGVNYCVTSGNTRIDSDSLFDNSDRSWTILAERGKTDLRSVMEHEFGHGIGIGHSDQVCDGSAATPLMCAAISAGQRKVILDDDATAASDIYALSGSAPSAPAGLNGSSANQAVTLTWVDTANNELAFEIQRASGSCSATFRAVATTESNTTTFKDDDYGAGLTLGSYCYRIKALGRGGDSLFSPTFSINVTNVNSTVTPVPTTTSTPDPTGTPVPTPDPTGTPVPTPDPRQNQKQLIPQVFTP